MTDINGTLLADGVDAVRARHDRAQKFEPARRLMASAAEPVAPGADRSEVSFDADPDMSIIRRNAVAVPKFPTEVFGPAEEWVKATAASKSAPIDYVALNILVVAAAMIGPKRFVSPWDGWKEPSILNGGLIGDPSTNKSPSLDDLRSVVQAIEAQSNNDWPSRQADFEAKSKLADLAREKWDEEIEAAFEAGENGKPMPSEAVAPKAPTRRRLWIVDSTTEQVARILGENPAGLICFRDELAGLLGSFDRYGGSGTDRAFWLEAYGARPYRYDRVALKGEAVDIQFCAVSLLGGIQPDRLNSMLLTGDDDGLPARFIWAWPDPVRPQRPTATPDHFALRSTLQRLADLDLHTNGDGTLEPRIIPLEADAADDFCAWWQGTQWDAKLSAGRGVAGAIGKLDGIALRIAQTLEFLTWAWGRSNEAEPASVSVKSVNDAIAVIDRWARHNIRRVFAEASLPEAQRDAAEVARWLMRNNHEVVNARDLRRQAGFTGPKDPKRLDAALEFLTDAHWLKPVQNDRPGRPRKDFAVNPKVHREASV